MQDTNINVQGNPSKILTEALSSRAIQLDVNAVVRQSLGLGALVDLVAQGGCKITVPVVNGHLKMGWHGWVLDGVPDAGDDLIVHTQMKAMVAGDSTSGRN